MSKFTIFSIKNSSFKKLPKIKQLELNEKTKQQN